MRTKKIVNSAVLIALTILLPQAFHLLGVVNAGPLLLPMHIPVLLSGFILGPVWGFAIGFFAPIISAVLTGMPASDRLPFMVLELMTYGGVAGMLYNTLGLWNKKYGKILSLIGAMVCGRIIYALSLWVAAELLHIPGGGIMAAVIATVAGIYGIIIQLLLIPAILYALERSHYIEQYNNRSKKILER